MKRIPDLVKAVGPFTHFRRTRSLGNVPGGAERRAHLLLALRTSGVELGAYDVAILSRFSDYSDQTVRVLAGWIVRAHLMGMQDARQTALDEARLLEREGEPILAGVIEDVASHIAQDIADDETLWSDR